jgi:preprotein translocase subunit YajC
VQSIAISLVAQSTTGPTTAPVTAPWFQSPMIPLLLGIMVLYIFMFRSKGKERKQRELMLAQLKRGDRVQTIGGILGTVVEARDVDVLLKVDESSNTKIRFARSAINRVIVEEKVEAK